MGSTLAIALGFILSSWLTFTPQAFAEKKMSRNVTVEQYRKMYGTEPKGEWVIREGKTPVGGSPKRRKSTTWPW